MKLIESKEQEVVITLKGPATNMILYLRLQDGLNISGDQVADAYSMLTIPNARNPCKIW